MNTPPTPRSLAWKEVEQRYSAPMHDILLAAHMQYGTWNAMATALGIDQKTVRDYWILCGLPEFGKQDDGSVSIVVCGEVN